MERKRFRVLIGADAKGKVFRDNMAGDSPPEPGVSYGLPGEGNEGVTLAPLHAGDLYIETTFIPSIHDNVYDVKSKQRRNWRYRCLTPREAQAVMRGVMLGERGGG